MHGAQRIFKHETRVTLANHPMVALDNADALLIVTEWKEFRSPDFTAIKQKLKSPLIFDGRNLYDPKTVKDAGLDYHAIGR
jgi:UDPglucose 6-dehydrogenase